jgi:hypothetical protein
MTRGTDSGAASAPTVANVSASLFIQFYRQTSTQHLSEDITSSFAEDYNSSGLRLVGTQILIFIHPSSTTTS